MKAVGIHPVPSLGLALIVTMVAAGCSGTNGSPQPVVESDTMPAPAAATPTEDAANPVGENSEPTVGDLLYPDVVAAKATQNANGTWRFDVTLSSPYDAPDRYADAWRILSSDGTQLGVRILTHHHADEQPFTRFVSGIEIPADVTTVVIEGRDQVNGWGGATIEVALGGG